MQSELFHTNTNWILFQNSNEICCSNSIAVRLECWIESLQVSCKSLESSFRTLKLRHSDLRAGSRWKWFSSSVTMQLCTMIQCTNVGCRSDECYEVQEPLKHKAIKSWYITLQIKNRSDTDIYYIIEHPFEALQVILKHLKLQTSCRSFHEFSINPLRGIRNQNNEPFCVVHSSRVRHWFCVITWINNQITQN